MDSTTVILAGIVVALGSGILGRFAGAMGKVSENQCVERRDTCDKGIQLQLDYIQGDLRDIKEELRQLNGKGDQA